MEGNNKKTEAKRCLENAGELLMARDFIGSKKFALLAQQSDPLLTGVDHIISVADVLLAAEKSINNHLDWYAILQIDRRSNDLELIKKQYRKLAFLLHPDKNKSSFAEEAFTFVADAWTILSDPSKKLLFDNELNLFTKLDFMASKKKRQQQLPRRSPREKKKSRNTNASSDFHSGRESEKSPSSASLLSTFWTACPYCYNMYEYPRVYEECCLRCQNCKRPFHAAPLASPPPMVPGEEAYFYSWGFYPLGFSMPDSGGMTSSKNGGFPNWMPFSPMFPYLCEPQVEETPPA